MTTPLCVYLSPSIRWGAFRTGYKVSVVYERIAARAAEDGDWELGSANT